VQVLWLSTSRATGESGSEGRTAGGVTCAGGGEVCEWGDRLVPPRLRDLRVERGGGSVRVERAELCVERAGEVRTSVGEETASFGGESLFSARGARTGARACGSRGHGVGRFVCEVCHPSDGTGF
jgi:hypothetical protein